MNLRKAGISDKQNILDIINNLLRLDSPWNEDGFVETQVKNGEYFLAEIDGKTAGIISLRQKQDKIYIETLAVEEKFRLKGIGSQLVEFAKQFTKERGLASLRACSFFEYKAEGFYEKLGFSRLGKTGKYNGRKYHRFAIEI